MALLTAVNIWVRMTDEFRVELDRAIGTPFSYAVERPTSTGSSEYPRLNYLLEHTRKMLLSPETGLMKELAGERADGAVYSAYLDDVTLSDVAAVRKELQELEKRYYPQFEVLGAWDTWQGEPIGGQGSPWIRTPPAFRRDFILRFGQPPRKFV